MWVPNRWEVKFWPPVRYLPVGWWHFVKSFWACWMMLDRNWSGYSLISVIQMEKTINVHQLLPEYWPAKMRIMGKNLRHYILLVIFCQPSQFGVQVLLRGCSWLCKGSQIGSLWFVWNHFKSPGYGEGERWIYHRLSIQVVSFISQSYTIIRSSNGFPGESHAQKGRPTLGPWKHWGSPWRLLDFNFRGISLHLNSWRGQECLVTSSGGIGAPPWALSGPLSPCTGMSCGHFF